MFQQTLTGKEKALGPDHTSILNNLGILYKAQGRLEEAEMMFQRALAGKEKAHNLNNYKIKEIAETLTKLSRRCRYLIAGLFHRK